MERTIGGRYALGGVLGAGAMGVVHAARDLRLDREVAVKLVPLAGIAADTRPRFVREARIAAGLAHPNAVAVFDAGETSDELYLVMELVAGRSLAAVLTADGPLPIREAERIAGSVLAALAAAHRAGIVHRDVKPGNVMLGNDGRVKLTDFGIAKRADDATLTQAGQFHGTPSYVSPEQVAGAPATPASDLYAVGVLLFEMLTGRAPFAADSPLAAALAHRDLSPPDLRSIRDDIPPGLAAVVAAALAKEPAARYRSADEMRAALQQALDPMAPTAVMPQADRPTAVLAADSAPAQTAAEPRRRMRYAVWAVAAAMVLASGIAAALVVGRGGGETAPTTTAALAGTDAPAIPAPTTAPPTEPGGAAPVAPPPGADAATTTDPPPAAPPPELPTTPEELIAVFSADPQRYGQRTDRVIDELEKIAEGRGQPARRAARLLDDAGEWAERGELTPEAVVLLEAVIRPLADDEDQ